MEKMNNVNYLDLLGYEMKPINSESFDAETLCQFFQILSEKFGRKFVALVPYINGMMIIYKNKNIDRRLEKRQDHPLVCDILNPIRIHEAIKVLNNDYLNELYSKRTYNSKNHHCAIAMARNIHQTIMGILQPEKEDTTKKFNELVQRVCRAN